MELWINPNLNHFRHRSNIMHKECLYPFGSCSILIGWIKLKQVFDKKEEEKVENEIEKPDRRSILKSPTDESKPKRRDSETSQKRVTMSEDVASTSSDEEPMCEILENRNWFYLSVNPTFRWNVKFRSVEKSKKSNSKWIVKLGVPEIFIRKPDSIKVKVSKRTILIRSVVDENGRSNALKVSWGQVQR